MTDTINFKYVNFLTNGKRGTMPNKILFWNKNNISDTNLQVDGLFPINQGILEGDQIEVVSADYTTAKLGYFTFTNNQLKLVLR